MKHNKAKKTESNIFGYAVLIFIFSMLFILIPILIFSWEAVLVFYGILALLIYSYWSAQIKEIKPYESSSPSVWKRFAGKSGKRRREEERRKRERDFANDEDNYY